MTKLRVNFSVDIEDAPAGITQDDVQAMVDLALIDRNDGRYPYAVETLERAALDIVRESIREAMSKHFRQRYKDRRVFTDREDRGCSYLIEEMASRRIARSKSWVRLHRKYDENDD